MEKFVYLLYGDAYEACVRNAVMLDQDAFTFMPFKSEIVKKIQIIHNARPLNTIVELPFKTIWFKRALKGMKLDKNDNIYFLLYESFHLSYSKKFLHFLLRKYPNSNLCFMYLNPVTDLIYEKLDRVSSCIDAVITFNEKDAIKYGYLYCQSQPFKLPFIKDDNIPKSDVFFVGSDKGRLEKLIKIYDKLEEAGLKCDFHIVDVSEERKQKRKGIIYNQKIPYSEVLARVNATKCILEILQNDENYLSVRTFEAIQYNKKLLTESKKAKEYSFYDPQIIQIFDNIDDINVEFITNKMEGDIFADRCIGEACVFHDYLKANIPFRSKATTEKKGDSE